MYSIFLSDNSDYENFVFKKKLLLLRPTEKLTPKIFT